MNAVYFFIMALFIARFIKYNMHSRIIDFMLAVYKIKAWDMVIVYFIHVAEVL
jgi:hypothetical protein